MNTGIRVTHQADDWRFDLWSDGLIEAYQFGTGQQCAYHITPNMMVPISIKPAIRRIIYTLRDKYRHTQRLSLTYRISTYHFGKTHRVRTLGWYERTLA